MFVCNKLLLGLTGSISTLMMPYNIFFLRQKFAQEVNVIMTYTAQQLITPYAIELCSGAPVFTRHTQISDSINVPHIELPADSDLFLIMPATANVLAKAAHGICDDLLSTAIVSCKTAVVFVPSMNEAMWTSRIVQQNVNHLKSLGHYVIEPIQGYEIANMQPIYGVMPPIETVVFKLNEILHPPSASSASL